MSHFVLDASVAGAWLLEHEDDPVASAAMSRLATAFALVPQLWQLEVRNTLVVAERRGRVGAMGLEDGLRRVGANPRSRNESMAHFMAGMGFMERRGGGWLIMRREMLSFNGTEPQLLHDEPNRFVRVTFRLASAGG